MQAAQQRVEMSLQIRLSKFQQELGQLRLEESLAERQLAIVRELPFNYLCWTSQV
jgi:hypothetical protein